MTRLELSEVPVLLGEARTAAVGTARFRALLIRVGWGSSGYYGEEVLRRDGPRVWPAGTQNYLDHPSMSESVDRPERSVKDLASVTVSDPVWDPVERGLVAEIEVFPQWRDLLNEEFASKVGLSIRAYGQAEHGEAEGREGPVITRLTEGISVDWVTRAGAGGRVLELIESARAAAPHDRPGQVLREARNVGHWIESRLHLALTQIGDDMFGSGRLSRAERLTLSSAVGDALTTFAASLEAGAPQLYQRDLWDGPDDGEVSEAGRPVAEAHGMTANDLRDALASAVREQYGGKGIWTWVRDHTDEWVVFSVEDNTDCDLYQQTYTVDTDTAAVTLTGQPVAVIARTTYQPAPPEQSDTDNDDQTVTENAPGSPPADTPTTKEEGAMPELTEAEARKLQESHDAALAEAEKARNEAAAAAAAKRESDLRLARFEATEAARPIAATMLTESGLPAVAQGRLLGTLVTSATVPLTGDHKLDESAFRKTVEAAVDSEKAYLASLAEQTGAGTPRGLGEAKSTSGGPAQDQEKTTAALVESFKANGMSEEAARLAATGRPF